jgi:hypothetical protein
MSLRTVLMLGLPSLPYAWLGLYWANCLLGSECRFDGHMLFYTFIALLALPVLIAIFGWSLALGGARQVTAAGASQPVTPRAAMAGVRGGVRFWIGLSLLLAALPVCLALASIIFATPEEGRDSLGRICETNGSRTTCRPDPAADWPSELDRINAARKRQRWLEGR